jgi:hypothetical protein
MITIDVKTEHNAYGVALLEEATEHAPIVGLIKDLKVQDVCVAERDGLIYRWAFNWDPETEQPDGIIIMENGELQLFDHVDPSSWLAFVLGNILRSPTRCTLQHYVDSGILTDAEILELLYVDLLGRQADPGGLTAYLARLAEGLSWDQVRSDLIASDEFKGRGITVFDRLGRVFRFQSLMSAALKRDNLHGQRWIDLDRYDDLDDTAFCNTLYQSFLGHPVDEEGRKFYVWALSSGRLTRGNAARRILHDNEMQDQWSIISSQPEQAELVITLSDETSPSVIATQIESILGEPLPDEECLAWFSGDCTLDEVIAALQARWDPFFSNIRVVTKEVEAQ